MKRLRNDYKHVHYVTYEYKDPHEKDTHMQQMTTEGYEVLDHFEDADSVIYRKFYS